MLSLLAFSGARSQLQGLVGIAARQLPLQQQLIASFSTDEGGQRKKLSAYNLFLQVRCVPSSSRSTAHSKHTRHSLFCIVSLILHSEGREGCRIGSVSEAKHLPPLVHCLVMCRRSFRSTRTRV